MLVNPTHPRGIKGRETDPPDAAFLAHAAAVMIKRVVRRERPHHPAVAVNVGVGVRVAVAKMVGVGVTVAVAVGVGVNVGTPLTTVEVAQSLTSLPSVSRPTEHASFDH